MDASEGEEEEEDDDDDEEEEGVSEGEGEEGMRERRGGEEKLMGLSNPAVAATGGGEEKVGKGAVWRDRVLERREEEELEGEVARGEDN